MSKDYRFRYVNQLAGVFVLSALGLFVGAILYAGFHQGWFDKEFEFVGVIRGEEGSLGLRPGNEVRFRATKIGAVRTVEPVSENMVEVTCRIKDEYRQYLRATSTLLARKEWLLGGDASLEIVATKDGDPLLEGGHVRIVQDTSVMDDAKKTLADIQQVAGPMVEKVDAILSNIEAVSGAIASGKGAVGTLVTDPEAESHVKALLKELNASAVSIRKITTDAQAMVKDAEDVGKRLASFADSAERAGKTVEGSLVKADEVVEDIQAISETLVNEATDLDGLVYQARQTLKEIERLTEGAQKHWLFRKHIDQDTPTRFIPAADAFSASKEGARKILDSDDANRA